VLPRMFMPPPWCRVAEPLRRTRATLDHYMERRITQRELRNDSGNVMRGLDRGDSFVVTRNGVPVGELRPIRRRRFVSADATRAAFAGSPKIDVRRFRADLDRSVSQRARPRG